MTVDVASLTQALNAARNPSDGGLAFTGTLAGSSELATLLGQYFDGGVVALASATVSPSADGKSVLVGGVGAFQQLQGCGFAMTLTPDDTGISLVLDVTPGGAWTLDQVFAPGAARFPIIASSALRGLSTANLRFVIASGPYVDPVTRVALPRGLSLVGPFDMAASLPLLQPFVDPKAAPVLYGAVTDLTLPLFELSTSPFPVSFGKVTLADVSCRFATEQVQYEDAPGDDDDDDAPSASGAPPAPVSGVTPLMSLKATLSLPNSATGQLVANLPTADSRLLSCDVTFANVTLDALSALEDFFPVDPLSALPSELGSQVHAVAQDISLTRLAFSVDPQAGAIQRATATLSVDLKGFKPFQTFSAIAIEELELTFTRTDGTPSLSFGATASLEHPCPLRVTAQSSADDSFVFTVTSDTDQAMPLSTLLPDFLPGLSYLPEVQVDAFSIDVAPAQQQYGFVASLEGSSSALPNVTIRTIEARYDGQATPSISATIGGTFTLGSPVGGTADPDPDAAPALACEIVVSRLADGDGWVLDGQTDPGTRLPIRQLVEGLAKAFVAGTGVPVTVPGALADVTLDAVQVHVDTHSGNASFACSLETTVESEPIKLLLSIDLTKKDAEYTYAFGGTLQVGPLRFTLGFDKDPAATSFIASYSQQPGAPSHISLQRLIAAVSPALAADVPADIDIDLEDAKLVFARKTGDTDAGASFAFGLDLKMTVGLSDLPVVGHMLPPDLDLSIDGLQVTYCSSALSAAQVAALNPQLPSGVTPFPSGDLPAGVSVSADVRCGDAVHPVRLGLSDPSDGGRQATARVRAASSSAAPAGASGGTTKWFDLQKTLGPISLRRIGLQYSGGSLFFLLDAALSFGPLTLGLDGLGLGSPLASFEPEVQLDGLSVAFDAGPVAIDGALLRVDTKRAGVTHEYAGAVTIEVPPYLISGVAGYAETGGSPSLFIFAQVVGALGGPPPFFVVGLMGGFGYNSRLLLPAVDAVDQFPFVAGLVDPMVLGSASAPLDVLDALDGTGGKAAVLTPSAGDGWIAAGVMFRSFELILGRALVVVTFGHGFEVALLGLASASLPQGASPDSAYAYAELQLEATLDVDGGTFSVLASLTPNSFLLTRALRLTGGFGFCLWFGKSQYAGDFVLAIGGYHPAFTIPDWYPRPARVGYNWSVSSAVVVKGGSYFALTPTAIMAGGSLEVLFHAGDLRAWFTAYADIMIRWKPFFFQADIGVGIGASYRLNLGFTSVTLSVELDATLTLWGPPTGGTVHIDLAICSFNISFGADPPDSSALRLDWSRMKTLLPTATGQAAPTAAQADSREPAILTREIGRGLIRRDGDIWIVRADELMFTTHSAVPASCLQYSYTVPGSSESTANKTFPRPSSAPASINIRPMGLAGVTATHTVRLSSPEGDCDLSNWAPTVVTCSLPEALWGAPLAAGAAPLPTAVMIPDLPTGVSFTAPRSGLSGDMAGPVEPATLVTELGTGALPLDVSTQRPSTPAPTADPGVLAAIRKAVDDDVRTAQQALVAALASLNAAPPTSDPLSLFAAQADVLLTDTPLTAASIG
ncbi:DUF6603 domain-containing protein [Corallococcus exiguus]|uniref:DUF6603 domain-containing protein n=1 Tax=Corallococcus exiguus TaxID=83462 RepID=A0A7X4Y6K3_9BACT|nr:DUF6603 domain-containing protein [Corallococcus exiguus]NBC39860.1 hypothetical protein [Corallococcus exiguus]TNV63337.1 hypothetical protein FH620_15500 [Corallococcus exiguus]